MLIDSRYSRSFYSDRLSKSKYNEIKSLAVSINIIKNELSEIVSKDLMKYLDYTKNQFQTFVNSLYKNEIGSNFIKQIADDVYITYQNKFEDIQKRLNFESNYEYNFTYYKRNTKYNKAGDYKGISIKRKSTKLTVCLTYLGRYGNDNTYQYLIDKIESETNKSKLKFYKDLIEVIDRYEFNRLLNLALSKRKRIIKRYSVNPIKFTSLTFRGRSRLSEDIISYNDNFKSIIKSFANISWLSRGEVLSIPIKYAKSFHGDMKRFTNGTDTSYTIYFEDKNRIRMILSYADERFVPDNKEEFVGIDVNVKHNLLTASDGSMIDYDRKTLDVLIKEMLKLDKLKQNKNYVIGRAKDRKIKHLQRELISKQNESFAELCKEFNAKGYDHVVFEDLDNGFGKSFIKDENGLNFNRIVNELKISSVKDRFEHIARKYDIAVSFTNKAYTSQTCSRCGCIDSENRQNQEDFVCIECNYSCNADINAAINIRDRIASTVLRSNLHNNRKLDNGTFQPKNMKYDKVKDVLLSLRYNNDIYYH